mgnify:CR=1 FL=1
MALTPFALLEKRISASVDRLNAERVGIEPRLRGPTVAADTSRAARTITAVVDIKPVLATTRSSSRYNGADATVNAEDVHVSATVEALGEASTWPRVGDHLRMLDRDGSPAASVQKVDPDGMGRVVFKLSWVK